MYTFEYEVTQYTSNGHLDTTTGESENKLKKRKLNLLKAQLYLHYLAIF